MSKIKIGWSEKELLPNGVKVNLAGQFYERITNDVETPLTVTVIAIDNGEDSMILCSCDLVTVSSVLVADVREVLKNTPEVPSDKVMIHAIHSHTGPEYAKRGDAFDVSNLEILEKFAPDNFEYKKLVEADDVFRGDEARLYIANQVASAIVEAWETRKEGKYATAFGRAAVGMCRRVCYDDGSAKMWGDTNMANFTELEGGNDSGIEILFTFDDDKNLTGVIANVACPAQVLEHRSFISSDYWGKVKENLRKEYGEDLFVLGICSPAGDQCPRDLVRWVEPETPINDPNIVRENVVERIADPSMFDLKGCKLIGRRIADEIKYAFEDVENYIDEAVLIHKSMRMDLPIRRVTIEENNNAVKAIEEFFKNSGDTIDYKDKADLYIHAGTVARYESQQTKDLFNIEVHFIRLGDIAFATNPFELFLDYGNQMRARSRAKQTFLVQLCCGAGGYLPTEKAEKGSHYSAYVSSGRTGHIGGEMLVRKTLTEINEMF